jgi:hypothetical protein
MPVRALKRQPAGESPGCRVGPVRAGAPAGLPRDGRHLHRREGLRLGHAAGRNIVLAVISCAMIGAAYAFLI